MATTETPDIIARLDECIAVLDDQIDTLTVQRNALVTARETFTPPEFRAFEQLAKQVVAAPVRGSAGNMVALNPSPLRLAPPAEPKQTSAERERDAERKRRSRAAKPKAPASTPEPKRIGRPPGGQMDYRAIAADIIALRAAGTPVYPALAKKYGVTESAAKNWPKRCRDLGMLPKDPDLPLKVIEDNTGPDGDPLPFDAATVASVYLDAVRNNRRPIDAVTSTFNIDRLTAISYVDRAREARALPPANEPQLPEDERRALLAPRPEPA